MRETLPRARYPVGRGAASRSLAWRGGVDRRAASVPRRERERVRFRLDIGGFSISEQVSSAAMILDERTLSLAVVVLAIAVVALAVWVGWLQRSDALLRRRLRRILPEGEASGIDEILDRQLKRIDSLSERHDALNKLHHELEELSHRTIQKVGIIRYNPFADTGGDQSFAIALLDSLGNGVVLSSLHSRTDTRVFAKPVQGGRSRYPLSDEEQDAIRKALAPTT